MSDEIRPVWDLEMALAPDFRKQIESVANEALDRFEKIASAAKSKLRDGHRLGPESLAIVNTATDGRTLQRLDQIGHENRESHQVLANEPAIARIVVADGQDRERTFYICRATPVTGIRNLASYRAPIGRLASLPVGSGFTLPNGNVVEVLERAQLRPAHSAAGWDSDDTVFETDRFGPVTVESLRSFLGGIAGEEPVEDLVDQILAEEQHRTNLIEGVRRNVITKMGLRDQPVLDQYQDEIFRQPLDKRLLILGPPGTGKTTTLIRRLGQKLDRAYLEEDEERLVERVSNTIGMAHSDSWLMFTPTELLKQYVKEAFAREGVPASDFRIRTWQDYRRELARGPLGVLRTASGAGTYVMNDSIQSLRTDAVDRPIDWFADFDDWQRTAFFDKLRAAAKALSEGQASNAQEIGRRLHGILERTGDGSLASVLGALATEASSVQSLVASLKEAADTRIRSTLNLQLNRNRDFLDELARYIDGLKQVEATDFGEPEDSEADEEDEALVPRTRRAVAVNAYMQAVRAQARAAASKRQLNRKSRNGKIVEWLGDRTIKETDRARLGADLLVQSSARRFANPVKSFINGVPRRYRAFRRLRQDEGIWYAEDGFRHSDVHPLELDVVLLAILRSSGELLNSNNVIRDIDDNAWSSLKPVLELCRNQILVDEATDFSPLQLACMAAFSHPHIRSFFACGDFNQRLTTWGARSVDDLKWVFPDLVIEEITIAYRQSIQLNELAREMIYAVGGTQQNVSLPTHVNNDGVAPALLESATEVPVVAGWLADRILEIERLVRQLPSTAIFVNSEEHVVPVAESLNTALAAHNIQVIACPHGQAMGQDNDVRVFDIQHIKGLEFEAVFFVAVDRLAARHPDLFDKYLYVGTTRSATYLGITCEEALPPVMDSLRTRFVSDWGTALAVSQERNDRV